MPVQFSGRIINGLETGLTVIAGKFWQQYRAVWLLHKKTLTSLNVTTG